MKKHSQDDTHTYTQPFQDNITPYIAQYQGQSTHTAVMFESGPTITCTAGIPPGKVVSLQGTLVEPGP